ncbi:hypothetical protein ES703_68841 [subsurface metagenome]
MDIHASLVNIVGQERVSNNHEELFSILEIQGHSILERWTMWSCLKALSRFKRS